MSSSPCDSIEETHLSVHLLKSVGVVHLLNVGKFVTHHVQDELIRSEGAIRATQHDLDDLSSVPVPVGARGRMVHARGAIVGQLPVHLQHGAAGARAPASKCAVVLGLLQRVDAHAPLLHDRFELCRERLEDVFSLCERRSLGW